MSYEVLLYYSYLPVEDPAALVERQRALCQSLSLTGRIIIASEGINGTLEGTSEHTQAYIDACAAEPAFEGVVFKRSVGTGSAFRKLSVKHRNEIVSAHLGEQDVNPHVKTGQHVKPEQLHEWIHSGKELYIVDMRNDYEHAVGHFSGSILPPIRNFRDLPAVLPQIEHLKGKTVVTVCTGGVRCEKASGFLLNNGFSDVYQLDGGIVTYMEQYPNEDFKGALYVFDGRVTMGFNQQSPEYEVVGRCEYCGTPTEEYINCADDECHRHFLCCKVCSEAEGITFCEKVCSAKRQSHSPMPIARLT